MNKIVASATRCVLFNTVYGACASVSRTLLSHAISVGASSLNAFASVRKRSSVFVSRALGSAVAHDELHSAAVNNASAKRSRVPAVLNASGLYPTTRRLKSTTSREVNKHNNGTYC